MTHVANLDSNQVCIRWAERRRSDIFRYQVYGVHFTSCNTPMQISTLWFVSWVVINNNCVWIFVASQRNRRRLQIARLIHSARSILIDVECVAQVAFQTKQPDRVCLNSSRLPLFSEICFATISCVSFCWLREPHVSRLSRVMKTRWFGRGSRRDCVAVK